MYIYIYIYIYIIPAQSDIVIIEFYRELKLPKLLRLMLMHKVIVLNFSIDTWPIILSLWIFY
jgi:type IV secretory pathway ATPase VirB11/archaellum biosynthesis ATPase